MTTQSTAHTTPIQPGTYINNYEVAQRLGGGGFGTVYEAKHTLTGRAAAIKVCDPVDEGIHLRFLQEAEVTQRLRHPNIITVHDVGVHTSGELYIIMERLHGHDLSVHLSNHGPLTRQRALSLFIDCLDGLHEAHTLPQPIVHKDLKPSNLFLTQDTTGERLIILDFGIARLLPDQDETIPEDLSRERDAMAFTSFRPGMLPPGTPPYWAPEYLEDARRVSPAVDVYQMGLILCEALCAHRIVQPPSQTAFLFAMAHARREHFNFPDTVTLDTQLWPILQKATALDPEDRYPNAGAFADALRAVLNIHTPSNTPSHTEYDDIRDAFTHKPTPKRLSKLLALTEASNRWEDFAHTLDQLPDNTALPKPLRRGIWHARAHIAAHQLSAHNDDTVQPLIQSLKELNRLTPKTQTQQKTRLKVLLGELSLGESTRDSVLQTLRTLDTPPPQTLPPAPLEETLPSSPPTPHTTVPTLHEHTPIPPETPNPTPETSSPIPKPPTPPPSKPSKTPLFLTLAGLVVAVGLGAVIFAASSDAPKDPIPAAASAQVAAPSPSKKEDKPAPTNTPTKTPVKRPPPSSSPSHRVVAGPPNIRGSLDKAAVLRTSRRGTKKLLWCYQGELRAKPSLGGSIQIKYTVSPGGKVTSAIVATNTTNSPSLGNCARNAVRGWTFSKPTKQETVIVTQPFTFAAIPAEAKAPE